MAKKNIQKKNGVSMHRVSEMCKRYGPDDYMQYLNGDMKKDELILFEQHCKTCSLCRSAVRQEHKRLLAEIDEQHEKKLLEMAFNKIEEKFRVPHAGFIDIIVRTLGKTFEIIQSTAEALLPEPAMALRGGSSAAFQSHSLRLVQAIEDPPLSVQLQFVRIDDCPAFELVMTVFDKQLDNFVVHYCADIHGPAGTCHQNSSDEGELVCRIHCPGIYTVCLKRNGSPFCDVRLECC